MGVEVEENTTAVLQTGLTCNTHYWTKHDVEKATKGTWIIPPPEGWAASGLSIFAPAIQPGNMAVLRTEEDKCGILASVALRLTPPPSCLITSDPAIVHADSIPLLRIANNTDAILAMGRYARDRIKGRVLGVTGSAGKTTCVAMVAEALSAWGHTCKSNNNANLPRGVAWNIASMPWDSAHIVVEMAIGRMAVSSRMVRPEVAIFTNIQPAHLGENTTVHDVALTKSAIFVGMAPGGVAILNRDMLEWETVSAAADARQQTVVNYGTHPDCQYRLLDYDAGLQQVTAQIGERTLRYRLDAGGKHMALNSLAALAAVDALGYPLEPAIEILSRFTALAGRGEEKQVTVDGRALTMIDDAYNANPGSMQAAIERLSEQPCAGRRIAVLGEMAELGPGAENYHTALAPQLNASQIDRIYLAGERYAQCWSQLDEAKRGAWVATPEELKPLLMLPDALQTGDTVLFKGSNSTKVHQLVSWINTMQRTDV